MTAPGPMERARAAWGEDMPDWVHALAMACERSSQVKVAKALDRSGAVVSQILGRTYLASTARIEERVRGVYLRGTVMCPAMDELPLQECQDWRAKSAQFVMGNPLRQRMYRACRACPRNQKEAEE